MSGLEIGLITLALILMVWIITFVYLFKWRGDKIKLLNINLKVVEDTRDSLWKEKCDTGSACRRCESEIIKGLESGIKDLHAQLKQIKDLREAGKEWWMTVAFLDDNKKHVEEMFKAGAVEFDLIAGMAFFFEDDDCCNLVWAIKLENYILHKKELVDVDSTKEEK